MTIFDGIWPFDAVQGWFEDLWNWVSESAYGAARWIFEHLAEPLQNWFWQVWYPIYTRFEEAYWITRAWSDGIPYPLNLVFQFLSFPAGLLYATLKPVIEGLWDRMPTWIRNAIAFLGDLAGQAWGYLWAFVKDPVGSLSSAFNSVKSYVWERVDWLKDRLNEGWSWITSKLDEAKSGITNFVSQTATWIKTNVGDPIMNGVNSLSGWVQDAIKGVAEAVGSGFQALVDWLLKHLTWFSQMIIGAVNSVVAAIQGFITDLARRFLDTLTAAFSPHSPDPKVQQTMKVMVDSLHKRVVEEIKKMYKSPPATSTVLTTAGSVATLLGVGILSIKALAAAADAAHPTKDIGFKDIATSMIAGTGAAVAMSSIIRMPVDVGLLTPLRHAYNETFRPAIPHIEEAQRMLWRGVISEEQFMSVVHKSGFGSPWAEGFLELTKVIPGVRDLITFVVREVITPKDFYSWSAKQGLSEYWAKAYWDSHWVLPSFGDLREAFWRGIISESEFKKYVVWHDYSPSPRPGISKSDQEIIAELSYDLPGRIDSRWMFRWGEIDLDTLTELFRKQGLHPAWVERVARATAKNQWLTEINRLRDNAKRKFVDGLIDEYTLRADLRALGYPPAWIEFHVQDALQDREYELNKALIDVYEDSFQKDLITYETLESNLAAIIKDPKTLDLTLQKAWIRKYKAPKPTEAERARLEAKIRDLEADVAEAELTVKNYESDLEDIRALARETLDTYDVQIGFLREDLAAAVEVEERTKLERRLALLIERREKAEASTTRQIHRAEYRLEKARARLDELTKQLEDLRKQLAALGG